MSILHPQNHSCSYLLLSLRACTLPALLLRPWQAGSSLRLTKLTAWTVMQLSGLFFFFLVLSSALDFKTHSESEVMQTSSEQVASNGPPVDEVCWKLKARSDAARQLLLFTVSHGDTRKTTGRRYSWKPSAWKVENTGLPSSAESCATVLAPSFIHSCKCVIRNLLWG